MNDHIENVTKQAVEDLEAAANRAIDDLDRRAGQVIADLKARAEALAAVSDGQGMLFSAGHDHFYATEIAAGGKIGDSSEGIQLSGAVVEFQGGPRWSIGSGPATWRGPRLEPGRYRMIVAFKELTGEK